MTTWSRARHRLFGASVTTALFALLLAAAPAPEAPVADAAMNGDLETVRSLLRSGADVNAPQGDGMTALHWAAERHDPELARMLIYAGANVDAGTRIGNYTPLHIASRSGSYDVVKLLLEAGGNPTAVSSNSGATPLHLAAASASPATVSELLKHGADPNVTEGSWSQTPLIFAAANNRAENIQVLLEAGADPNLAAAVVDVAKRAEADEAAQERLMDVLADFKEREGGGAQWQPTPSQVQGAIELARQIQVKWPDVPQADEAEGAPDVVAAGGSEPEPTGAASSEGADSAGEGAKAEPAGEEAAAAAEADEEADDEEQQPLSYAELVDRWGGLTPLLHAVRQGYTESALALLDGGADINQPSAGDHTTPLLMAAVNGQWDLAVLLLERGADPNIASLAGATPLYAVLEREWEALSSYAHPVEYQQQQTTHLQMMKALLEAGADPNARLNRHLWYMEYTFGVLKGSGINLRGATPFWRASYALDVDAMRMLKDYGADTSIPTMKPPERQRRGNGGGQEPAVADSLAVGQDSVSAEVAEAPADSAEAEGESADNEDGADEDPSGLPPVPTDGPAIYPIHAASGVGYGQSFAGNAHRHVRDGWLEAVKFLVEECNADVNARDHNGYTPLHHAASRGDNEMILYLVEHGADVTVLSREGQTTADMANGPVQRVQPYPETVALLERLGSKNNHKCVSC